jgi:hypothetical protein
MTKYLYGQFGDFRTADYIELSWLGVDVFLRDIFVRQRTEQNRLSGHRQGFPLEYCVLEGVGAVSNRLGQEKEGVEYFIVEISGYVDDEDNRLTFQFRPSAKMVWNKTNEHSQKMDIHIPNSLSRHLIELFVTKRIDKVEGDMRIWLDDCMADRLAAMRGPGESNSDRMMMIFLRSNTLVLPPRGYRWLAC